MKTFLEYLLRLRDVEEEKNGLSAINKDPVQFLRGIEYVNFKPLKDPLQVK